jgi:hypothetical protein
MKKKIKYELYSQHTIEVRTIIEATSEEEALKLSKERELSICWHGSSDNDAEEEWVIVNTNDAAGLEPYINDEL